MPLEGYRWTFTARQTVTAGGAGADCYIVFGSPDINTDTISPQRTVHLKHLYFKPNDSDMSLDYVHAQFLDGSDQEIINDKAFQSSGAGAIIPDSLPLDTTLRDIRNLHIHAFNNDAATKYYSLGVLWRPLQ